MNRLTCLFFLLLLSDGFSQETVKERRIECSAGYTPRRSPVGQVFHVNVGLSYSAKKPGWFTNYALHLTRHGAFDRFSYDYHTLSVGKFREWHKRRFYSCLGLNAGFYLAYDEFDEPYRWYNIGIAVFPKGEIGWTNDHIFISFGVYFPIGYGYYKNPGMQQLTGTDHMLKGLGALSPYVKVQF